MTLGIGIRLIEKIRNLAEILLLPGGMKLKLIHRSFHWRDYRFCLRLKASGVAPHTIFDVGANTGQFAIGAMAAFPEAQIISYEPGSRAFGQLQHTFANDSRVKLINKAVGDITGETMLHVTNADQSSSLLELGDGHLKAYPEIKESGQEPVQVITLENEIRHISPQKPILLKIDTQGFEMQVLRGAGEVLEYIQWIVFETTTQPMYQGEATFDEILPWLQERGFVFQGPIELHVNPSGKPCQFDALFEKRTSC